MTYDPTKFGIDDARGEAEADEGHTMNARTPRSAIPAYARQIIKEEVAKSIARALKSSSAKMARVLNAPVPAARWTKVVR